MHTFTLIQAYQHMHRSLSSPIAILFLLLIVVISACDKKQTTLKGCCGNPAIDEDFGFAHLYVPNVFTPNADALNDLLRVAGDSIRTILSARITDRNGKLIHEVRDLPFMQSIAIWDGTFEGEICAGSYHLVIKVRRTDGKDFTFEGSVCNYPCGDLDPDDLIAGVHCQHGDQVDSNFHYDPTIVTGEPFDCFR